MGKQEREAALTNPALAFIIVFGSSLVASAVLYGALKSSGIFARKGVELGGAAAGFVVILYLANRVFKGLQKEHLAAFVNRELTSQRERISELQHLVARLRSGELPAVQCPDGFEVLVSRDLGVGFAHPKEWEQSPERFVGIFMRPLDQGVLERGFRGNISVTVTPVPSSEGSAQSSESDELLDELLKTPIEAAIKAWSGENVRWKSTYLANRKALEGIFDYPRKEREDKRNVVECVVVFDNIAHRLFIFALYECEEAAEPSRELFRRMLSTVTFLS